MTNENFLGQNNRREYNLNMNPESRHPFHGELTELKAEQEFDVHKLEAPTASTAIEGGEQKEFKSPGYVITEYFDGKKNHESFVKLKRFYEKAQEILGDYLPKTFFVEGEPSNPKNQGRSFYVIQRFDNPEFNTTAKTLQELNSKEFSVEFINRLLDIQKRINQFLEECGANFPTDWVDADALDPKKFKEDILHSPPMSQTRIVNLFKLGPELAKQAIGSSAKFKPSVERLRLLKALGLAHLVEKIDWALERSAAPEWIRGKNVYWQLSRGMEGKKVIALTFDDGPNDETEKLLDILKEQGVKATFFLVGSLIAGREHIVKRIKDEGHDVGVHEWTQEGARPGAGLKEYLKRFVGPRDDLGDVKRTIKLIEQITGKRPRVGRVSGVHGTVDSLREFQAMNLKIVHADPIDVVAIPPSPNLKAEKLLKISLRTRKDRKIALFHIGTMTDKGVPLTREEIDRGKGQVFPADQTLAMIETYISDSKQNGYEFVKVDEYTGD